MSGPSPEEELTPCQAVVTIVDTSTGEHVTYHVDRFEGGFMWDEGNYGVRLQSGPLLPARAGSR